VCYLGANELTEGVPRDILYIPSLNEEPLLNEVTLKGKTIQTKLKSLQEGRITREETNT